MARALSDAEVDKHVGQTLRARRKQLKLSQTRLADHIGVTFQQVQKYERGTNRVSASKLFRAAVLLEVEIGYFFPQQNGDAARLQILERDSRVLSEVRQLLA